MQILYRCLHGDISAIRQLLKSKRHSLPLSSTFPGSRVPTAHVAPMTCRFQSYAKTAGANEIDNELDKA